MWRGAWDEAERELTHACDELAICRPGMTADGRARLGELRRRQGRLDEAADLFERSGPHPIASLGRAAIALDRGDRQTAADLVERHLRRLPLTNRTERAAALAVLVRAHTTGEGVGRNRAAAADHDLERAQTALEELRTIAEAARTAPLQAAANLAAGLVALAAGDLNASRRELEDAVDGFDASGAPFEAACARIDLASVMDRLGRADAALAETDRALAELERLDARLVLTTVRAMRDHLTVARHPAAAASRDQSGLTPREMDVLRLISSGLSNQAIAERLHISEHTVHRHVANTLSKLDVPSRSAAVAHAAKLGLL
jgi:ATP/maltotriose-dependent transcriptional regulator MalT